MAIQSDGKIVLAGTTTTIDFEEHFAVARYNADGSLDNTFKLTGKTTVAFGSGFNYGKAVAIQNDGKILVAGYTDNGVSFDFAVARFNTDGTLDNTFDEDGKLTIDFGASMDAAYAITVQSDGKILLAGSSNFGALDDFAIVRLTATGSLDNSFNGTGKAITRIGTSNIVRSIVLQPDGKIVVSGTSYNSGNYDFALVRYNSDGTLDNTFDGDGKLTTDMGAEDFAWAVALQADGRIVVAGYSHNGMDNDFALARYTSAGTLDNTFDGDGKLTTDIASSEDQAYAVHVQNDGKIIAGGRAYDGSNYNVALVRYGADGSLDNSFDGNGKASIDLGGQEYGYAIALRGTTIYWAGSSDIGGTTDFAVVAVQNDAFPLPISLISFTASRQNSGAVTLNWQTLFEQNTSTFDVQRSSDGRQFTTIGSVKASGFSTSEKGYQYLDAQPLSPVGYYRLKTVDTDKKESYSPIVLMKASGFAKLEAYPNPATSSVQLQYMATGEDLRIYDVTGRVVKTMAVSQRGIVSTVVDIRELKKGVYLLRAGGKSIQLIKQ
jgi:uncharacterized delta-60 repeat protein